MGPLSPCARLAPEVTDFQFFHSFPLGPAGVSVPGYSNYREFLQLSTSLQEARHDLSFASYKTNTHRA